MGDDEQNQQELPLTSEQQAINGKLQMSQAAMNSIDANATNGDD
jgi:hypothetical protein